jgi:archaemetzincin
MHEVFLAPLEFASNSFLERIRGELSKLFTSSVNFLNIVIDLEAAYSIERNQFYSTAIIAQASEQVSGIKGNIILLLQSDLYVPVLTYVFGEAQLNGNLSVVSLCRLHEEFYTGVSNENLLLQRVLKEILHELGHNYGLFHCRNWECVMHSSSGIEEVDIKGDFFCNKCISAIKILK